MCRTRKTLRDSGDVDLDKRAAIESTSIAYCFDDIFLQEVIDCFDSHAWSKYEKGLKAYCDLCDGKIMLSSTGLRKKIGVLVSGVRDEDIGLCKCFDNFKQIDNVGLASVEAAVLKSCKIALVL